MVSEKSDTTPTLIRTFEEDVMQKNSEEQNLAFLLSKCPKGQDVT